MRLKALGPIVALACALAAFFACTSVALADGWTAQSSGTTALYGISFADAGTGWAVGLNGTILATSDGGAHWTGQGSAAYGNLSGVFALGDQTAVAVGDNGMILKTTDGGTTWVREAAGLTSDNLVKVNFAPGSQTGYVVSVNGYLLKTMDGGSTWAKVTLPAGIVGLNGVSFRDANHGMVVGMTTTLGVGVVAVTTDGGSTWRKTSVTVTNKGFLNAVADVDASHSYLVGDYGSIWTSSDDGLTWTSAQTNNTYDLYDVKFVNAGTGIAVGTIVSGSPPGIVLRTVDSGATWQVEASASNDNLNGAAVVDSTLAYACDNTGTIVKYSGGAGPLFTAASGVAGSATTGWIKTSTGSVTLTASGGSGTYTIHDKVDGGTEQTASGASATFSVSGEGSHSVEYWSTDGLTTEAHHTAYVNIDTTAPTTTDNHTSGWYKAAATITLSPSDGAGSGVASTTYKIDGGAAQSGTSVVVSADGTHTVTYASTDAAGNVEATHSITVKVDKTAPVTTDNHPALYQKSDVTVTLTPTDATSGVASTGYKIDGGATQTGTTVTIPAPANGSDDGAHVITYWSTDVAGNVEAVKSCTVHIDTTAPVTSDDFDGLTHSANVIVTLSASDPKAADGSDSGVASTTYQIDGGTAHQGTSVDVGGAGTHTVTYWSTDNAGNVEAPAKSISIEITNGGPGNGSITIGWLSHDWTATLTPDPGALSTAYQIDNGSWVPASSVTVPAPADHSNDGMHTVAYHSVDADGAAGLNSTVVLGIDTRAPVTTDDAPSGWQAAPVAVVLTATDPTDPAHPSTQVSGVASTSWQVDGGAWQTGALTVSGNGSHVVDYRSTDNAGNVEATKSCTVRIDTAAPVTTNDAPTTWQRSAVTVHLTPTDGGSGVAQTSYSLDGGLTWTSGTSVAIPLTTSTGASNDGLHTITYFSTDNAGNAEAHKTCSVTLDSHAPTITAATFKYKAGKLTASCTVTDALPPGALPDLDQTVVRLAIVSTKTKKTLKTFTQPAKLVNAKQVGTIKIKLAKGAYTIKVTATDSAGNVAKAKSVKLTVK